MTILFLALIIFLDVVRWIVIADVVLSWLQLAGVNFRPAFISSIIDPIYGTVRKYIPTRIGMFDFTPIVIILLCFFLSGIILTLSPETGQMIQQLSTR